MSGMKKAFSSKAMSRRDSLNMPGATTYLERFVGALKMLCIPGSEPPVDLCQKWLSSDNEELQTWVCCHLGIHWATGIGTIEAARHMADHPEEGVDHQMWEK